MRKFAFITATGLFFFLLAVFYGASDLTRYIYTGGSGIDESPQTIIVAPRQRFIDTAAQLAKAGIIQKPSSFRAFACLYGYDKRIKAGEYQLSASMSPAAVLEKLVSGKVVLHRLTVPEGYTFRQIAALVKSEGFAAEEEFLRLSQDAELTHELGIPGDTLEGYLYPDTYFFPKGASARDIITAMTRRFESVMTGDWKKRAAELQLSIHQIATLASIIEKESGTPEERPVIASVFYNRINRGMRLESDPTVIYGIKNYNGNITREHLEEKTPYNTYQIEGLPPGPIANPGQESLKAALYPQQTDFLYFVSKNNGTHQFSKTFKEHTQAVCKYQLGK